MLLQSYSLSSSELSKILLFLEVFNRKGKNISDFSNRVLRLEEILAIIEHLQFADENIEAPEMEVTFPKVGPFWSTIYIFPNRCSLQ